MESTVTIPLNYYEQLKKVNEAFNKDLKNGDAKAIYIHSTHNNHTYYVKTIDEVMSDLIKYNQELRNKIDDLRNELKKEHMVIKEEIYKEYKPKKWYNLWR